MRSLGYTKANHVWGHFHCGQPETNIYKGIWKEGMTTRGCILIRERERLFKSSWSCATGDFLRFGTDFSELMIKKNPITFGFFVFALLLLLGGARTGRRWWLRLLGRWRGGCLLLFLLLLLKILDGTTTTSASLASLLPNFNTPLTSRHNANASLRSSSALVLLFTLVTALTYRIVNVLLPSLWWFLILIILSPNWTFTNLFERLFVRRELLMTRSDLGRLRKELSLNLLKELGVEIACFSWHL